MHQGGVRTFVRAMLVIAAAGFLVWGFSVKAIAPSDLVISKIQITGGTGLSTHDFVTIYNKSAEPIDLKGFRLVKRTKTGTTDTTLKSWTTETLIAAGSYYTWANADIAATINANTSSSQTISNDNGIALREGPENSGTIIDSVGWGAAENIFIEASAFATNPGGGQYLERINNADTNDNSVDFQIYPPQTPEETANESQEESPSAPRATGKDLIINELYINPKDIDGQSQEQEFIELYNKGSEPVVLDNWRLEIGEIVFELPRGTTLAPHGFTSIRDPKNIPLPNDGATIKLFSPTKATAEQSVSYKKAPDGMAYASFSGAWRWTATPTPDQINILAQAPITNFEIIGTLLPKSILQFDSSDSFTNAQAASFSWDFGDGQTSAEQYPKHIFNMPGKYKISLTVVTKYGRSETTKIISIIEPKTIVEKTTDETAEEELSKPEAKPATRSEDTKLFTTAGSVITPPGLFSVQYWYLLPEYGEPLIQIYNSKKLFPKLAIGDEVIVSGEYSETENGPRLKTKIAADTKVIGQTDIPEPSAISTTDATLPPYPRLVQISGEVLSKKSPRFILKDELGELEIYLSKNTGLKIGDIETGDQLTVSGILTTVDGAVRLQPRNKDDIKKTTTADFSAAALPTTQIIAPTMTETIIDEGEPVSTKKQLLPYVLGALAIFVGGIIYFANKK